MSSSKTVLLACVVLSLAAGAPAHEEHQHPAGDPEQLGTVHFPVSCSPAAQKEFERAVAIQHSFWFEEAGKAFATVTATDPSCAMGYWGIAMSLYHPLWDPPDATALQQGWEAVAKAKAVRTTHSLRSFYSVWHMAHSLHWSSSRPPNHGRRCTASSNRCHWSSVRSSREASTDRRATRRKFR